MAPSLDTLRQGIQRHPMMRDRLSEGATSRRMEGEKMNIETVILVSIFSLMMAGKKKKKLFGQMTLGLNSMALEYLRTDKKAKVVNVRRILWLPVLDAQHEGYALPTWVTDNIDKYEWCCILFGERATMPLLVYQSTALRGLEAGFSKLEEQGANILTTNRTLEIDFGDNVQQISFYRNEKGGRFAPFHVEFIDE